MTAEEASQCVTDGLIAAAERVSLDSPDEKRKKNSMTSFNPYIETRDGEEVIDVSVHPKARDVFYASIRFDDNYVLQLERISLDSSQYRSNYFDAWSFKRVKIGEDPNSEVPDKQGKMRPRFAFTGSLSLIAELERALSILCQDSKAEKMISYEDAMKVEPDKYGVRDISAECRPVYSKKVLSFSIFRVMVDDAKYNSNARGNKQEMITYKALTLCKEKNEKCKSKSKNDDDYFVLQIPARQMYKVLRAVRMLMDMNGIKRISPISVGEAEAEEVTSKMRKPRRRTAISPVYVTPDTDDEEEDANVEYDVDEDQLEDQEELDDEEDEVTPTVQEEEEQMAHDVATASDEEFVVDEDAKQDTDEEYIPDSQEMDVDDDGSQDLLAADEEEEAQPPSPPPPTPAVNRRKRGADGGATAPTAKRVKLVKQSISSSNKV